MRPIESVIVSDLDDDRVQRFIDTFGDEFDVRAGTISEAAQCDVLSTVTPVEDPIVSRDASATTPTSTRWVQTPKASTNSQTEVIREAKLVIDDLEQTTHSGEINVPWSTGVIDESDIDAELGEIVVGNAPGRDDRPGLASSTRPVSRFRTLLPRVSCTNRSVTTADTASNCWTPGGSRRRLVVHPSLSSAGVSSGTRSTRDILNWPCASVYATVLPIRTPRATTHRRFSSSVSVTELPSKLSRSLPGTCPSTERSRTRITRSNSPIHRRARLRRGETAASQGVRTRGVYPR